MPIISKAGCRTASAMWAALPARSSAPTRRRRSRSSQGCAGIERNRPPSLLERVKTELLALARPYVFNVGADRPIDRSVDRSIALGEGIRVQRGLQERSD